MIGRIRNWWAFGALRWRFRACLSPARRWWWNYTHEHCCNFSPALFAWLAPRLELYAEGIVGAPGGYPDPENTDWGDGGPYTDFDAWERDVKRAAVAFRRAAERVEWVGDKELDAEIKWAMNWLARWHGGIWH